MSKPPKRPIDAKDMPQSYLGKDGLDKAAEQLWEFMRETNIVWDDIDHGPERPYHMISSGRQEKVQRAVLSVLGNTVPTLLRDYAKEMKSDGFTKAEYDPMRTLADELENDHG